MYLHLIVFKKFLGLKYTIIKASCVSEKGLLRVAASHKSHREVLQVSCILSTKGISVSFLKSSDVLLHHHKRIITDYKNGSGSDSPNTDI